MSQRYFGTDGIRGTVGEAPMTPDFALHLGWAAGRVLLRRLSDGGDGDLHGARACVLIGKDTRLSGYMFESALEAGFAAAGIDVLLVGPLATPGIAYLTRTFRAVAGVVISASHNPFEDNGVKFFSHRGQKLDDAVESEIEQALAEPLVCVAPEQLGRARRVESASGRYIEFCKSTARLPAHGLRGVRLVVDCANGAAYQTAPEVFRELGAEVHVIGNAPDGLNINLGCGSTHPEQLAAEVVARSADAGIALDGDADRCIMIDAAGRVVDGDQLLFALAEDRHAAGELTGPVVGTLMSNLGLALALEARGIAFERAKVGDRYVFERLLALGGNVGGESSGHLLCLDRSTTGDGTVSALQVLSVMGRRGIALADLVAPVEKCPQSLINVRIGRGSASTLMSDRRVQAAVDEAERDLGGEGRVLLRPSGTEPLLRVMVEGLDVARVERHARDIADAVEQSAAA
ncbi:phosphoglucosamine mutase [Salinisphaera sp. Q1T1-3]|uniref:phosphoglucosamine mutase n=1 Tax=Salinisphaera sp. Q1T1-3 TaxID=2321229 RepID=UPI000E75AEC1|nr:phosphoglucosamine mutase [Salinisphaera sp. Q1T1-3]RJS92717.1 phosphoglucosamine mutase [Salinisphaera sp. Q1T1-3]